MKRDTDARERKGQKKNRVGETTAQVYVYILDGIIWRGAVLQNREEEDALSSLSLS